MKTIVRCVVVLLLLVITVSCRRTGSELASTADSRAPKPAGMMSSTDDLKDKRIGVLLGSVHDTPMPDLTVPDPRGDLVIGVAGGGLPFAAVRDGVLVGFDIELAQRFAASLGRTVKFSQMPFGSLIAAAATGKVEMIIASIFITDERKQLKQLSARIGRTCQL